MTTRPQRQVDRTQIDYSSHAPFYDERRFQGGSNSFLENLRRRTVLRLIGQNRLDRKVLDVGCGTGRGLLYLRSSGFTNLTGVDFTHAMLSRARQKTLEDGSARSISLVRGDAFQLGFEDRSFDVVISMNFIHLFRFETQQKLIHELARVCRPGGLVVVEFENIHKGLLGYRWFEQRSHRETTKLNNAWEIFRLFSRPGFAERRILGTDLPLAHRIWRNFPRVGEAVESMTYMPLLRWAAARVVVAGRLPEK